MRTAPRAIIKLSLIPFERKRRFRQWKMRMENVFRLLFTQHKVIASTEFGISTSGL